MAIAEILGELVVGGLMGMIGQGARAVIGLKKLREESSNKAPDQADVFMASRLMISLMIGFITGVAALLLLGGMPLAGELKDHLSFLMGIAAAGYAGTDAIEAFVQKLPTVPALVQPGGGSSGAGAGPGGASSIDTGSGPDTVDLESSMNDVHEEIATIKSMLFETAAFAAPAAVAAAGDLFDEVTSQQVKEMFVPATPLSNIVAHLPNVVQGLRLAGLVEKDMLVMALATIRAETESFRPISEGKSIYNTKKTPFDRYEPGTPVGKELGNTQKGDGARYKGRGFVQLTGRDNYTRVGGQLSLALASQPELANQSDTAGRILGQFLKNHASAIRQALTAGDLREARRLVNGGSHGFARFKDAFEKGQVIFKDLGTTET